MSDYDVIVVGAGNAALAASVSARNSGAERVLVLEKAPEEMRGGNTHYSGGLLRIAFDRTDEILRLVPRARELEGFVEGVEPYPAQSFWSDLRRMTGDRSDPDGRPVSRLPVGLRGNIALKAARCSRLAARPGGEPGPGQRQNDSGGDRPVPSPAITGPDAAPPPAAATLTPTSAQPFPRGRRAGEINK